MKLYGMVPYKYALYIEANCSAVLTISPLGLIGVVIRQLVHW